MIKFHYLGIPKTVMLSDFPGKDQCFKKEFQATNPGDIHFYSWLDNFTRELRCYNGSSQEPWHALFAAKCHWDHEETSRQPHMLFFAAQKFTQKQ